MLLNNLLVRANLGEPSFEKCGIKDYIIWLVCTNTQYSIVFIIHNSMFNCVAFSKHLFFRQEFVAMQNKADILQLIQQGENKSVEFKNQKVKADSLAKEIIAFANSDGGTILIGVNDDGIDDQKTNYEEWIANISRNNIIPSIESKYFGVEIENKKVGVMMISKGQDKPYQTTSGKYYIRIGSTNRIVIS
jgi:hypothetical protein